MFEPKNTVEISLKYVTNFNPNFFVKSTTLNKNFFKKKNNEKINCKSFILFVLLLKNTFTDSSVSVFVKPKKSSIYNILRAPYKNKMSRHQLTFSRFYFNLKITLSSVDCIRLKKISNLPILLNSIKSFYSFLESNVCFQHKSRLCLNFWLNDYFFI